MALPISTQRRAELQSGQSTLGQAARGLEKPWDSAVLGSWPHLAMCQRGDLGWGAQLQFLLQ